MAEPSPQRAYRAACPNCGAQVDFRSAASASAVCSYCRSTLVREGEALRRIGASAELFEDYSPLQLGAAGRYQGEPFTLVGRLQMAYAQGAWNEWHALFDNGRRGWLSEDNGAFVFSFDLAPDAVPAGSVPPLGTLRPGQTLPLAGRAWSVAAVTPTQVGAAQGELPWAPQLQGGFTVAELRNAEGEVASLDDSQGDPAAGPGGAAEGMPLHVAIGRGVRLADLAMQGLREASEKALGGRSFDCPSCGSALTPKLEQSLSIVCGQCHAVVDLSGASEGVGGRAELAQGLAHHAQATGGPQSEPLLPLGATGTLALGTAEALPWQVVGYLERCEVAGDEGDEPQSFWREYLLYHRREGFVFLVDAEDGWSWMRPITGAPLLRGDQANWAGAAYRKQWDYPAKATHVLGEFYWRVQREDRQQVTDYQGVGPARHQRLSREVSADGAELTWSAGATIDAAEIARAFKLAGPAATAVAARDTAPVSSLSGQDGLSLRTILILVVVALVIMVLVSRCGRDDCGQVAQAFGTSSLEYQQCLRSRGSSGRTTGGSWGGYSGGGSHK